MNLIGNNNTLFKRDVSCDMNLIGNNNTLFKRDVSCDTVGSFLYSITSGKYQGIFQHTVSSETKESSTQTEEKACYAAIDISCLRNVQCHMIEDRKGKISGFKKLLSKITSKKKKIVQENFDNGYDFIYKTPHRVYSYSEPQLTWWTDGKSLPKASIVITVAMSGKLDKCNLKAFLKNNQIELGDYYYKNINPVTAVYYIQNSYVIVICDQLKNNCADLIHLSRILDEALREENGKKFILALDVASCIENFASMIEFISRNKFPNIKWLLNVPINDVSRYRRALSSRWIVSYHNTPVNTSLNGKLPTTESQCFSTTSEDYYYKNSVIEIMFFMQYSNSFIINDLSKYHKDTVKSLPYSAASLATKKIYIFDNNLASYLEEPAVSHLWGYDGFNLVQFNKEKRAFNTTHQYIYCSPATEVMLDHQIYSYLSELGINRYEIRKPNICAIQGVPGCGKSTWLLKNHVIGKDLVLSSTKETIVDLKFKVNAICESKKINFRQYETNYRTIASYLLNGAAKYDTVYVDEYMMIHAGYIGLVAMKSNCSKIVLMGDNKQIPFIDRLHYVNMQFHDASNFINKFEEQNITYRCPADVTIALNHIYPSFFTTNTIKKSVKFTKLSIGVSEIPIMEDTFYITFTRADKNILKSKLTIPITSKLFTIHEAQGLTIKNVICIRLTSKPLNLFESPHHVAVALTRHTNSFIYFSPVDNDLLYSLIKKGKFATEDQLLSASRISMDREPTNKLLTKQFGDEETSFNIYFQNVNKMASKAAKFHNYVLKTQFAIYAICETSFHPDIHSSEFFPNEYVVYRCDRSALSSTKQSGGGVLLAVHSSIASELFELSSSKVEHVCVKLTINSKNLYVYVTYIPPGSNLGIYKECTESLNEIYNSSTVTDIILVMGDFNLTNINWTYDLDTNSLLPFNVNSEEECLFIDAVLHLNLNQINNIANGRGKYLDLILTNELDFFKMNESVQPFVQNDINHKSLEISFDPKCLKKDVNQDQNNKWFFNFKKADSENLRAYFHNTNWEEVFGSGEMDNCVDNFYSHIFRGFDLYVPVANQHMTKHPPWYDDVLINLKNIKNKQYKIMKRSNQESDQQRFIKSNEDFENYFNQRFKDYIANIQDKIRGNPKYFWNYFNSKRNIKGFPATMHLNGAKTSEPLEIANFFANFFQSVYKVEDIDDYFNPPGSNSNVLIPIPVITEDDIMNALSSFGDGCGPDGIPSSVLKTYAQELSEPLCLIYNKSLTSGIFPSKWKITRITPIFKSGHRSDITCYRGVTSISSAPKLFELILCNSFKNIVSRHISYQQHGFMPGRSTSTNLIEFSSNTIRAIENKFQVDVVYTDFTKAFDSISHRKALESLYNFGFSDQFIQFFKSYLTERHQYVEIGDKKSKTFIASSGVTQGSHCGPWFFIVFIDGVIKCMQNSQILMFADDLKIYRTIRNTNDTTKLQEDVNRLSEWCEENQLHLNISKCKVMSFHRKTLPILSNYCINNTSLVRVTEMKDLGVTFTVNMTFNKHIDLCIAKANSMLGFIRRWTHDISHQHTILILYFAYVRSQIEYAVTVWCPYYANSSTRIESIQKKFLLYLLQKGDWVYDNDIPYHENVTRLPPYSVRCQELNITSLSNRRHFLGASLVGNTLLGLIDSPFILENIHLQVPSRSLRQHSFLHLDTHRTNYGENEPINQICKFFNEVEHLFDFGCRNGQFKKQLKNYYLQNGT